MRTTLPALALLALLPACGTFNDAADASMRVTERHPITVDQQIVTVRVPIDRDANALSRGALAEIDDFVTSYRTQGHGPITVTAPSGTGEDRLAQQVAADVRAALVASGVSYEEMMGATVRTGAAGRDEIILSFSQFVASGPSCGRFAGEVTNSLLGRPSVNYGCATQANLAAMVADPRDLQRANRPDGLGDPVLGRAGRDLDNRAAVQVTYGIEEQ